MKILITGSNGLLGQKVVDLCLEKGLDFLATSSGENRYSVCPAAQYKTLDITDEANIKWFLKVTSQHMSSTPQP
jgi:dTDP-4-dehydrorhamnose reductase